MRSKPNSSTKHKDWCIRISRNVRLGAYLAGIFLCLMELWFHPIERAVNAWTIRRVHLLMTINDEGKHRWLGAGVIQFPADLITYAELIYDIKPEVIIETGTNYGGLAVFLATVLEKVHPGGTVVTIDIDSTKWDQESKLIPPDLMNRIVFVKGDSASTEVLEKVRNYAEGKKALVILDSLHTKEHVLSELKLYSAFVALNSYIIVNDTQHEILKIGGVETGAGAMTAIKEFLQTGDTFQIDQTLPRSLISCAPSGFLKRLK